MATYLILNSIALLIVCLVLKVPKKLPGRQWLAMVGGLLLLTLIFDNVLIYFDMFTYAQEKILGLYIGLAPIEDFMYPLLAALLIPAAWNKLGVHHRD